MSASVRKRVPDCGRLAGGVERLLHGRWQCVETSVHHGRQREIAVQLDAQCRSVDRAPTRLKGAQSRRVIPFRRATCCWIASSKARGLTQRVEQVLFDTEQSQPVSLRRGFTVGRGRESCRIPAPFAAATRNRRRREGTAQSIELLAAPSSPAERNRSIECRVSTERNSPDCLLQFVQAIDQSREQIGLAGVDNESALVLDPACPGVLGVYAITTASPRMSSRNWVQVMFRFSVSCSSSSASCFRFRRIAE